MRCCTVAHYRPFLLDSCLSSLCFVAPSLVDCLSSVAPPCNIAGFMLAGGHSEGLLIALRRQYSRVRLICVLAVCLAARGVFEDPFVKRSGRWHRTRFVGVSCCAQHPGIGHVIVEALLIILPKKSEGQPRTYRHRKLTFICLTGPCPAEASAASVQLKCTNGRIVTETRPVRNIS
jgi:hypothetical protein